MNFKPTSLKVTVSLLIGFFLGFGWQFRRIFGMAFTSVSFLLYVFLYGTIISLIIFAIWSLLQKADKKSRKKK